MNKNVQKMVKRIDRRQLTNNTQKVLLALLTSNTEWVARTSIRVANVSARIRDLRKTEFGGFRVECATAKQAGKRVSTTGPRQTFYRLATSTVTPQRVQRVFGEGVVTAR
jgi:hypothetical protein